MQMAGRSDASSVSYHLVLKRDVLALLREPDVKHRDALVAGQFDPTAVRAHDSFAISRPK